MQGNGISNMTSVQDNLRNSRVLQKQLDYPNTTASYSIIDRNGEKYYQFKCYNGKEIEIHVSNEYQSSIIEAVTDRIACCRKSVSYSRSDPIDGALNYIYTILTVGYASSEDLYPLINLLLDPDYMYGFIDKKSESAFSRLVLQPVSECIRLEKVSFDSKYFSKQCGKNYKSKTSLDIDKVSKKAEKLWRESKWGKVETARNSFCFPTPVANIDEYTHRWD